MNPISQIYNLIFYQPISQALIFFNFYLKDFGLAIICLTILIRLLLFPLAYKTAKDQEKISKIRKEMVEIEKKYDGEKKMKEIVALYQKEKINPFFSLFSLIIQFPILVALYQVFLRGVNQVDPLFLKILDLSKPSVLFALLVVVFQIFYLNFSNPHKKEKSNLDFFQNQMNLFLSFFTFLILLKLPSAIGVYLVTNFLFLIFQKVLFHV
jgi:YidC/Oxa1 family membrane protein insertase